jgi:hypothetical protein
MKFIIVLIILVLVAFILKVLKLLLKRAGESSKFGKKIAAYEPLISLFAWVGFIFWSVNYLFYDKSYYNFIVFALIVLIILSLSWFFVKDFVAGIAFKVQNNYAAGDNVQFGKISGRLDNLFLTHVSVYTSEGKLVKIPYSRLSNEIVSHKSKDGHTGHNKFVFKVPKSRDLVEIKENLYTLLINSPWRIPGKMPVINLKSEMNDGYEFEIQFETRTEQHLNFVVSSLRKKFLTG